MTTLASAVAYVELLHQGKLLASLNFNPIETYTVIAVVFFLCLFPLVQATYALERRLAGRTRTMTRPLLDARRLPRCASGCKALRRPRRAARHRPRRDRRASASRSSARPARARARCCAASTSWSCRAQAWSSSPARRSAARHRATATARPPRSRAARGAPARRHGVPAVQPVPAHDRARQRDGRAAHGARPARAPRRAARAEPSSRASAWPTRRRPIPARSRAARSSASPSPARWRWTPRCCCSTSRRRRSTRSWSARCCA